MSHLTASGMAVSRYVAILILVFPSNSNFELQPSRTCEDEGMAAQPRHAPEEAQGEREVCCGWKCVVHDDRDVVGLTREILPKLEEENGLCDREL